VSQKRGERSPERRWGAHHQEKRATKVGSEAPSPRGKEEKAVTQFVWQDRSGTAGERGKKMPGKRGKGVYGGVRDLRKRHRERELWSAATLQAADQHRQVASMRNDGSRARTGEGGQSSPRGRKTLWSGRQHVAHRKRNCGIKTGKGGKKKLGGDGSPREEQTDGSIPEVRDRLGPCHCEGKPTPSLRKKDREYERRKKTGGGKKVRKKSNRSQRHAGKRKKHNIVKKSILASSQAFAILRAKKKKSPNRNPD